MADIDKFINKENVFGELEFDSELEQKPLSDFEINLLENEKAAHDPAHEQSISPAEKAELEKLLKLERGIASQKEWQKLFNDLFLEIFDAENAFEDVCKNYTKALLDKGIQVAPHQVYQMVEMANTRMIKINIVKTLAMANGLHSEWPDILQKELSLIYDSRGAPSKPSIRGPAVGESD